MLTKTYDMWMLTDATRGCKLFRNLWFPGTVFTNKTIIVGLKITILTFVNETMNRREVLTHKSSMKKLKRILTFGCCEKYV